MSTAIGSLVPEIASNSSRIKNHVGLLEASILIGLGMAAVCLHASARGLIEMPGHQGLGWISLLMMGRKKSEFRWAAVTSSIGAAAFTMMPFWSFRDPFRWLTYLLAGATLDLLYVSFLQLRNKVWLQSCCGGLAHMTKPITRLFIGQWNGWPYGSLRWGVAYPSASHFLFGFLGALLGQSLIAITNRHHSVK